MKYINIIIKINRYGRVWRLLLHLPMCGEDILHKFFLSLPQNTLQNLMVALWSFFLFSIINILLYLLATRDQHAVSKLILHNHASNQNKAGLAILRSMCVLFSIVPLRRMALTAMSTCFWQNFWNSLRIRPLC